MALGQSLLRCAKLLVIFWEWDDVRRWRLPSGRIMPDECIGPLHTLGVGISAADMRFIIRKNDVVQRVKISQYKNINFALKN